MVAHDNIATHVSVFQSESSLEDSEALEVRKRHSLLREHGIGELFPLTLIQTQYNSIQVNLLQWKLTVTNTIHFIEMQQLFFKNC